MLRAVFADDGITGVRADERGFVVVDEHQRTSHPRILAAGDGSGTPQYVYVAAATGRVAALNATGAAGGRPATVDYTGMPSVVFTRPQLASTGLTEAAACAAGQRCESRVLDLADVPRALATRDTCGAVKLVAEADTEMMPAATYAITAAMTVDDVADTWAPHLTMGESLRLVAGLFRNRMPTSCCA